MINEKISNNLLGIFYLGDEDECSLKHLGHSLAAIVAFGDYTKAIDYTTPDDSGEFTDMEEVKRLWREIELEITAIGPQVFLDNLQELKESRGEFCYLDVYIAETWLPYNAAIWESELTYQGKANK